MRSRILAPLAVLVLALSIGIVALVASAKEPRADRSDPAGAGALGSVDMEEVYNASGAPQEMEQFARQHEAEGEQRINKIMAVPYLEAAELEEYGTLIGKAKMTPEEEKRADALKAVNAGRAAEVATLQGQANGALSAEGAARLTHLNDLKHTLQTQVRPGLVNDFRLQHEAVLNDYRHRQLLQLRQDVAKVAKDKGIAHVFDSSTLIYSVNDLTPAVLQRVKHAPKRGAE